MRINYTTRLMPVHIAAGLLLGGFCLSTAYGQASFQGLGDLPGGIFESSAIAASANGLVVVGKGTIALTNEAFLLTSGGEMVGQSTNAVSLEAFLLTNEAFLWTSGGGMVGLGELAGGNFFSEATDVSADGLVVVGQSTNAVSLEAFLWTNGGGMVGLGNLANPWQFLAQSYPYGVSANGSVVVGRSDNASNLREAFRWTSGEGMVGLGDLPGGSFDSFALGVSADGSVVVGASKSASSEPNSEAFLWTSGGGMVGLGDLAGGSFNSTANAVSADGSVVVGIGRNASGLSEAFRWTSGGGMVGLGDLPGSMFISQAWGVSADGSVVVGRSWSSSGLEAFIWDAANGMQSLRAVLDGQLGLDLTGWTLGLARGVSADGTTIVGGGLNPDGFPEAFIAVIPGPGVCLGDIVGLDGSVNVTDLLSLLAGWGPNPGHHADINDDGDVNVFDLLAMLAAWGACP